MNTCHAHPTRKAHWTCTVCGKGLCRACRLPRRRPAFCSEACASAYSENPQAFASPTVGHESAGSEPQTQDQAGQGASEQVPDTRAEDQTVAGAGPGVQPDDEATVVVAHDPAEPAPPGVKLPAAFYLILCVQTLLILVVAVVALGPGRAPGGSAGTAIEETRQPSPTATPAPLLTEGTAALTAPPSQPVEAAPPPQPPDLSSLLASPRLDVRDGGTLRGAPVLLRGSAPWGERVGLLVDGELAQHTAVRDGRFEFRELELPGGQHRLSVVAYTGQGPAVESPGATVRYEP
jgi:hypothetical protein